MFGSRKSDGAASTPATAPSAAASPQPARQHRRDADADEPRLDRVDGGRAQPEAELRAREEAADEHDDDQRDGDHADVLLREGDAADGDRRGRERPGELLHRRRPRPTW